MKVVLVHDWTIHMRGGERVLEALAELYPEAPIYTLFFDKTKLSPVLQRRTFVASFLQHLPGIKRYYRFLLPLLPLIVKTLRVQDSDLVLSTSHCVAKGIRVPSRALHVCYCHTPMRYIWGFEEEYFRNLPALLKPLLRLLHAWLRMWDIASNRRVDEFISNSENVRRRILEYYGRTSYVIHPPLSTEVFYPAAAKKDYYLIVSAFVPYKRVDLVIEAFNSLDRKLMIVGAGPLEDQYLMIRKNPRITFLGSVPDDELRILLSEAKALIFPTDEDFGIVPLEAQACGTPVIAFKKGGALESVKSGIFFEAQTS